MPRMILTLRYEMGAVGLAALLLTACPPKEGETGTDSDASSGGSTGGVSTTSAGPTTDDTPTTGGTMDGTAGGTMGETKGGTTADTATSAMGETEGNTTVDTDGEVPQELLDACDAACDKFLECIMPPPFPDKSVCVQGCTDAGNGDAMCVAAAVAFDNCLAGLNCMQFETAVETEDFGPCNDEFAANEMACEGCESFAGVGEGGCSLGTSCPGEPIREISCEGDTCTCLEDDVETGSCPANGVCEGPDGALRMLAAECCGFDL